MLEVDLLAPSGVIEADLLETDEGVLLASPPAAFSSEAEASWCSFTRTWTVFHALPAFKTAAGSLGAVSA